MANIENLTVEITMKMREDKESFILDCIMPFSSEVVQHELKKEDLRQLLIKGQKYDELEKALELFIKDFNEMEEKRHEITYDMEVIKEYYKKKAAEKLKEMK